MLIALTLGCGLLSFLSCLLYGQYQQGFFASELTLIFHLKVGKMNYYRQCYYSTVEVSREEHQGLLAIICCMQECVCTLGCWYITCTWLSGLYP